jgi:hypothetical protein
MNSTTSEANSSPILDSQSGEEYSTEPTSILSEGKHERGSIRSEAEKDLGVPVLEGWPLGSTVFAYVECKRLQRRVLTNYQIMPSPSSGNARHDHHIYFTDYDCFRLRSFRPSKLDHGGLFTDILWLSPDIHPIE